jgi:hypothetical protein
MTEEKEAEKYGRKRDFSAFGRICKWPKLGYEKTTGQW